MHIDLRLHASDRCISPSSVHATSPCPVCHPHGMRRTGRFTVMHPALSAYHPHGACPGLFVLTVYAQADSSSCAPLCQYVNLMACARADSSSWPQGTPASRGRRGAPAVPPALLYSLYRLPSRAAPVCCWSRGHRWRAAGGKGSRGSTSERRCPVTGRGGDLFVFIPGENLYIRGDVAGMLYCN